MSRATFGGGLFPLRVKPLPRKSPCVVLFCALFCSVVWAVAPQALTLAPRVAAVAEEEAAAGVQAVRGCSAARRASARRISSASTVCVPSAAMGALTARRASIATRRSSAIGCATTKLSRLARRPCVPRRKSARTAFAAPHPLLRSAPSARLKTAAMCTQYVRRANLPRPSVTLCPHALRQAAAPPVRSEQCATTALSQPRGGCA